MKLGSETFSTKVSCLQLYWKSILIFDFQKVEQNMSLVAVAER